VKKILGAGIAFSNTTKAAAAPLRRTWAAAAAALRSAAAMFQEAAAQARPIVHLAAAPAAALIRTFVVVIVFSAQGPARFLAPREPECLIGHVSSAPAARQAALAVAREVLSLLPIPKLHTAASPLLIPAFERIPASGDFVHTVDRVVAVPFFSDGPPPFSSSHDGWLHWLTLAAASPLIYVMVAHAINRVSTYRATIPRPVLDALMSASTRLRSGALELRRLGSPARKRAPSPSSGSASKRSAPEAGVSLGRPATAAPSPAPSRFSDALAKSLAVDEHLRNTLLSVPDTDPFAEAMHAFADRVQPADVSEIPPAFLLDGGLPSFANPELFLAPFSVRVQPPRTVPLQPVAPQPSPPAGFEPQSLSDLLTPAGAELLTKWYEEMHDYLLLIDDLAPFVSLSRRRRAAILNRAAAGDEAAADEMIDIIIGDIEDRGRSPYTPDVRAFLISAARTKSAVRPLPVAAMEDTPALWPELSVGLWEQLFNIHDYNGPSDDDIQQTILHARPEPLALGASCFDERARGIVWDLRRSPPRPVDYAAPISTHLNLSFVREALQAHPSYPDQEIFDHLLFGVRFKSQPEYQMILQPHLSSLPLGYENMHKELRRLRDKGFFECFAHPPFAPWQTLSNGVVCRKLEPDRPRRTTDGGSPRRGELRRRAPSPFGYYRRSGSDWKVDTDGKRVIPINSTRWPEDDLQRGTLEIFYRSWKDRLRDAAGSPPPFHPLVSFQGPGLITPPQSRPPSPIEHDGGVPGARKAVIIFSGAPDKPVSLSKLLRDLGWTVLDFDLLEGGAAHDVLLEGPADLIVKAAEQAHFVWLAPPCSPYSVAADDRPQLFSVKSKWWASSPLGCEGPPSCWAAYIRRTVAIGRFVARVILACHARRIPWVVENPPRRDLPGVLGHWKEYADYGTLWHALNADSRLASVDFQEVTFPYCALGAAYQKVTTLRSNSGPIVLAFRGLVCVHDRHEARLHGRTGDGQSATQLASAYPPAMIERVCRAVELAVGRPAVQVPGAMDVALPGPARGQFSLGSRPAAPALRLGALVDVDITRGGPTPHFANPFKMGASGVDGRLRDLATATYRSWLSARTIPAGKFPTRLPVCELLKDLTGEKVETALRGLFEQHGRSQRFHFVCGARCFGKACHGQSLVELAALILDSSEDPPFAKELKITVPEAMNDLAVLMHVSHLTGLPVIQIATDVSDFFNQHRLHPSEVPRVGLVTLDLDLLLKAVGRLHRHEPDFCNVADYVLGYGLFFASQIGQRHAYLLTFLWLVEMLKACGPVVEALCKRHPILTEWMERRRELLEPPDDALDPTAKIRFGQAQLFSMSMYTDDAHKKILSVELAVLGLRSWLTVTSSLNLTMAIVQKQMIGQFVTNQGLRFHSGLGIVYVPHDKLRRSFASISEAVAGSLSLRDYHSLLGLLQSLIFVVGLRRSATFGLWEPLAGAADFHPEHLLSPSPAICERLAGWRSRLAECAGASFEAGMERFEGSAPPPRDARLVFVFRSDASKDGARMPGLGGCLGGKGWRYPDAAPLSSAELELPIAVTEFVAFYGQVEAFGDEVPEDALVMAEVDALATALSLTEDAAQSDLMQAVFLELQQLPQFVRLRERMIVAHCAGDANILADAFSRGELETAREICRQMGMAYELRLHPPGVRRLMRSLAQRHRASTAPGVGNPNMAPSPFAHVAPLPHDERIWRVYESYLLALDDEALACEPTPPPDDYWEGSPRSIDSYNNWEPPDEDGFHRGWSPCDYLSPGLRGDPGCDAAADAGAGGMGHGLRSVVTSTTLGSHNISMDGRPLAHPSLFFPAGYEVGAEAPQSPSATRAPRATGFSPLDFSLPSYDLSPTARPTPSRKRADGCTLAFPEGYCFEPPAKRVSPLELDPASPAPHGLASRVSRMLEEDTSRLALRPTSFTLLSMCEQLYDPRRCTAARTSKGQKSAWVHWAAWCRVHNTDPWRLERFLTDTDHHREAVLQAGFIHFVHLRQSAHPRSGRKAALPSSAAKTLCHIRKMHKDRDFPMVASRLVQNEIRKLYMDHKARHGVADLIPKRKEPFTREILLDTILGAPEATTVGRFKIAWASRSGRSLRALTKTLASTGFRKAEISVEKADQPLCDCLTRAGLSWLLRGKVYASGCAPADLLSSPQPGDFAVLQPPPSKSDPFDMVWGSKPIFLPFSSDPLSAFTSLADIELNDPIVGSPELTALFTDDHGAPFTGHFLDRLLHGLLLRHFPESVAKNYSWHSCRIWLATALLASGASRAQIQALCRWQTDESLNVYACLGAEQYARLLAGAFGVRIDAARAATLAEAAPFICRHDVLAVTGAARVLADADIDADLAPDDDADDD
jgi:hypothetical protein